MESGEQVSSSKRKKNGGSVTGHIGVHPKHIEDPVTRRREDRNYIFEWYSRMSEI